MSKKMESTLAILAALAAAGKDFVPYGERKKPNPQKKDKATIKRRKANKKARKQRKK